MRRSRIARGDGSGARFIAGLLIVCLGLVAILALQAQYAARSHRVVAEGVLRDYGELAAAEFIRRSASEIGYYGYLPALAAVRRAVAAADRLPRPADLIEGADEQTATAGSLVRTIFVFHPGTGSLDTEGPSLSPEAVRWVIDTLTARVPDLEWDTTGGFSTAQAIVGSQYHAVVYGPLAAEPHRIAGFTVDTDTLTDWFNRAFGRAPLLPASLADGELENEAVRVRVVDPTGRVLFTTSVGQTNSQLGHLEMSLPFGDTYDGIFDGLVAHAAVDADAAPKLVIGGLPRSRLPVLFGLLALTVGLLGVAILILQRERAVARLRSDFVSRVSHELRTPLTQIRLFAETLLLNRDRSAGEHRRSLEIIDKESRRLATLVENVLQFARGERRELKLNLQMRDVGALLCERFEEIKQVAASGGARVTADFAPARAPVDSDAVHQIVLNLVDNAVKYGPDGQTLRIGTAVDDSSVHLWVDDEGPGIPGRERERIWEPFYRLERDRRSETAGTGIGLSVIQELAQQHGGRAWVEDSDRGGARFVVALPAEAATPIRAQGGSA